MAAGELRLLQQDGQLLVVHKPAGWTIYAEDGVPKTQHLQSICEDLFGQKLYPVHRLDRATCGIVLFAKDGRWAREMQEQFARRKVSKIYLALVEGKVNRNQKINIPLKEKGKGEQSAETSLVIKKSGFIEGREVTLVELAPTTGRFHQLRKHCKLIGHPIVGDKIYAAGKGEENDARQKEFRLMLSAVELRFTHPRTKKEFRIKDTPDQEFVDVLGLAKIRI